MFLNYVIDLPVEVNYPEEACPVIARPGPGFRYVYGRHAARESQALVRGFPRLHHFSYVRQDDRAILGQLMSFGHHDEVGQGGFKDKYLAWKADHAVGDLHPVIPGGYQGTRRVDFTELPQAAQRALPRLRREYPGMFEPEVD